jgi:hypothetical protein
VAHWHKTQVHCNTRIKQYISFFWHTGTRFKYIDELEFKTASLCFSVAHWHTTHVHCNTRIQNYISFFSGVTLAHDSSILYSSNSQLHLFLFRWHTCTRLKFTVLPEFRTASLCFWVAHWLTTQFHCTAQIQNCISLFLCGTLAYWHMTQVHCNAQIQNCISLFLGGTLAHWHMTQVHCNAQIQNCISLFSGGTLAHDLIPLYCSNSKLYLFLFGWHTGTRLKYIVQLEFTTASLSFQVAHLHTTQVYCSARIQNCISLFLGGTLADDSIPLYCSNSKLISLFLCGTLAHWHMTQVHCNAQIQNCISLFSGGTLAHDLIPLYCSNSKLYLFVFGWHTVTQFKSTVLLEFKTVSLSFRVAQWHLFISQGS